MTSLMSIMETIPVRNVTVTAAKNYHTEYTFSGVLSSKNVFTSSRCVSNPEILCIANYILRVKQEDRGIYLLSPQPEQCTPTFPLPTPHPA